jgi:hypothetical protein
MAFATFGAGYPQNATVLHQQLTKLVAMQKQLLSAEEIVAASLEAGPRKCGIYFLIKDDELKYVGQSIDVEARLGGHRWRSFDPWYWVPCLPDQLNTMERQYIDLFLPSWNSDNRTALRREELARSTPSSANEIERLRLERLRRAASVLE